MNTIPQETRLLAQHILETGKLMRDRIFKAQSRCMRERNMTKRYGELTQSQLEAIRMVRKNGPLGINDLAGLLAISSPSASVMVERLVEKGILTRAYNPKDRRKVMIAISDKAQEDIRAIENAILTMVLDLMERLGPETSREWFDILGKVRQALSDDDRDPESAPTA
ncbi:hypothetical protein JCM14469_06050 [Desulfatiferula olefinivorans]